MPEITGEIKVKQRALLNKIGQLIAQRAVELAPIDQGHLRRNITWEVVDEDTVRVHTQDVPYADAMEYGKPPGLMNEQEKENLKEWVGRKNRGGANLYAPAVIKKIEKEGIKVGTVDAPQENQNGTYRPFLRPAAHQMLPEIKKMVEAWELEK